MQITVDINESELDFGDLSVEELEDLFWAFVGEKLDPQEVLSVDLNIKVYDR